MLTQIVLFYSLFHCDDFKWGKTREVVEDDDEKPLLDEDDDLEKQLQMPEVELEKPMPVKEKEEKPDMAMSIRSFNALALEEGRLGGNRIMDTPKKLR